eukprot:1836223-Pyramimonas_sp.AAC.1
MASGTPPPPPAGSRAGHHSGWAGVQMTHRLWELCRVEGEGQRDTRCGCLRVNHLVGAVHRRGGLRNARWLLLGIMGEFIGCLERVANPR